MSFPGRAFPVKTLHLEDALELVRPYTHLPIVWGLGVRGVDPAPYTIHPTVRTPHPSPPNPKPSVRQAPFHAIDANQAQNLAKTVLYVPYSLDSGWQRIWHTQDRF